MHRIDSDGATPENGFTEGDVQSGTPATTLSATWCQSVQEELANVIEGQGIVLDKDNDTQLAAALESLGNSGGFKNYLINGNLEFAQRGNVLSGLDDVGRVGYDRWFLMGDINGGTGVSSFTWSPQAGNLVYPQSAFIGTPGETDYQKSFGYIGAQTDNGGTNSGFTVEQRAEVLDELSGEQVTFSIYLSTVGGANSGTLEIEQNFGAGGSPTVVVGTRAVSFIGDFSRFYVTGICDDISTKTIGPGAHIAVRYRNTAGETWSGWGVRLALGQLEKGSVASTFGYRPLSLERALVERYYETSFSTDYLYLADSAPAEGPISSYHATGTTVWGLDTRFRVKKRAAPTMRWWKPNTGLGSPQQIEVNGVAQPLASTSGTSEDTTGIPILASSAGAGGALGHWAADAEI